jgi:uncharacterized membrane protein
MLPQDARISGVRMQPEKQASSKGLTWGLAILFGALGASIQTSVAGFAFGALLGALLAQIMHLRSRLDSTDADLRVIKGMLEQRAQAKAEPTAPPAPAPQPPPSPIPATPPADARPAPQPRAMERPWLAELATETQASADADAIDDAGRTLAKPVPRPPSTMDDAFERFVAWLKRGNPLARIGIVILFFGAAFLAKYAADNSLFPIELRLIAIALGAFALLVVGWRLRDKRAVYSQVLQGGGIAGLYLTVFAATKLYQLLPFELAFGLMVVIALAAAVIAVAQNALALAVIGTAGGFLTPILVSTGSGNHVALFTYYALLNLGVFAVAWFKTWRVLNVLGFVFTFGIAGLWRALDYQVEDRLSADFFLILFFLMYVGVSILNSIRDAPNLKGYVSGSLVFGLPVVAFTLHASVVARIEYALAWSALALGAFYLLLGWILYRTRRENFRLLVEAFAALGVIFASLAIPLAFDTRTTAAMWAVEGAGLLWLGVRQGRKLARAFGMLLQVGAGVGYLIGLDSLAATRPILNSAYLGAVMLGVSGVFSGLWLHKNTEQQASYERGLAAAFTVWGVAWWLFGGIGEVDRFLGEAALGAGLVYVSLTAGVLAWLAVRQEWRLPRMIGLFLPALAALNGFMYASQLGHPFAEWGALGWTALLAAQLALLRLSEADERAPLQWLHAGVCWTLALLLAWEIAWRVEQVTTGVWASLPWGVAPALLVAWLGRRNLSPAWPVARHARAYRVLGAAPPAVAVCAWIVIINLTSAGEPAWLPYLPVLNPLDVAVALCMLSLATWWSSLDDEQRTALWSFDSRSLLAIVAGIVFLWLNAALIRALHHNWGAPITAYGIANSTLVQASLSIFWGVLGFVAMTLAAKQRWRYVWIVGAALMIIVVAKLFLVDLSSIGTIARIASFLTVGVLLLVTGYLAPLPPKRDAA